MVNPHSISIRDKTWAQLYELAFLADIHNITGILLKSMKAENHRQTHVLEALDDKINDRTLDAIERLFVESVTLKPDSQNT